MNQGRLLSWLLIMLELLVFSQEAFSQIIISQKTVRSWKEFNNILSSDPILPNKTLVSSHSNDEVVGTVDSNSGIKDLKLAERGYHFILLTSRCAYYNNVCKVYEVIDDARKLQKKLQELGLVNQSNNVKSHCSGELVESEPKGGVPCNICDGCMVFGKCAKRKFLTTSFGNIIYVGLHDERGIPLKSQSLIDWMSKSEHGLVGMERLVVVEKDKEVIKHFVDSFSTDSISKKFPQLKKVDCIYFPEPGDEEE